MRRKKHKQTRRATNYYRINYGFHEPYKVLLDGNFIHATRAINMPDLSNHLPKLLGGACKLYTTRCVSHELRSMGKEFAGSAAAARAFALHKCDHSHHGKKRSKAEMEGEGEEDEEEEGREEAPAASGSSSGCVAAAECIRAAIGRRNEGHWFVATQDSALRQELGRIPGCPLVFATVNGVHLETPSEVTRQKAKEVEAAARSLGRHEQAAEPMLRPEHLEALRRELRKEGPGSGGKGGMPPPTTSARFRRNKAKGPNPLAAKKKVKATKGPMTGSAAQATAAAASELVQRRGAGGKEDRRAEGRERSGGDGTEGKAARASDVQEGGAAAAAAQKRRRKRVKPGPEPGGED